jgi:hypothetical protein
MNSMDLTVIIDYRCRVDGNGVMLLLIHNAIHSQADVRIPLIPFDTCESKGL